MDDLDKQLAELQLITKGELKQNPNADCKKVIKKVGPAVPPKPKKSQIYSNLASIGIPKPYEKPGDKPADLSQSSYSNEATYENQDGLIYTNILHDKNKFSSVSPGISRMENRGSGNARMFPRSAIDLTADDNNDSSNIKPGIDLTADNTNSGNLESQIQTQSNNRETDERRNDIPQQFNLQQLYRAQPQVPTGSRAQPNMRYPYVPANPTYSNIPISMNDGPMYENTREEIFNPNDMFRSDSISPLSQSSTQDSNSDIGIICGVSYQPPLRYSSPTVSMYSPVEDSTLAHSDLPPPPPIMEPSSMMGTPSSYISNRIPNNPPPPVMGQSNPYISNFNRITTDSRNQNFSPGIMCGDNPVSGNTRSEELPASPSPVSSSYSELDRATNPGPSNFDPAVSIIRTSSTMKSSEYESIYEPINPRAPSVSSMRSGGGYSLYDQNPNQFSDPGQIINRNVNNSVSQTSVNQPTTLTTRLVQELDVITQNGEICAKCKKNIADKESGCIAIDSYWHTDCFTCIRCQKKLQGKTFYQIDSKPFCYDDYFETLEKCSVCKEPVFDRVLRATGKPYHPHCFKCVVCEKYLDSVPFTVDAANQIHCIEDFHKKFAPRCFVCNLPIMPDPDAEETIRVVALDRSFHIACYKCEDCGLVLSSESEGRGCYPLDDHVLCRSCNALRIQALTNGITTTDL